MESHYTADSCAEYLSKFYILPHTYKSSLIMGVFVPILFSIAFIVPTTLAALLELLDYRHHPNAHQHIGLSIGSLCALVFSGCFVLLSLMWRKTVITRHSIDITLTLSKTNIPANTVLGYAVDSIRQSKGPSGTRLSIVHQAAGKQQTKTPFAYDPDDLNDPKLRGLFMSMSNYGDVPLTELLDDASNDKYPRLEKIVLAGFVLLTSWILWFCLPLIHHAVEQLGSIANSTT
ncbi:hypothetical protein [Dyella caseinilytica]|uniref:Uncharacterized protein n=1 Tax=Dyella caseinilytica TaxID=1849581 RepID=A0ABX7GTE1_9GAMM|nr:hypothetical protein [Dyella caseinilytica]QRN53579.1 hypothetical protein ISN74_19590 [Dyella caseinilytica]